MLGSQVLYIEKCPKIGNQTWRSSPKCEETRRQAAITMARHCPSSTCIFSTSLRLFFENLHKYKLGARPYLRLMWGFFSKFFCSKFQWIWIFAPTQIYQNHAKNHESTYFFPKIHTSTSHPWHPHPQGDSCRFSPAGPRQNGGWSA